MHGHRTFLFAAYAAMVLALLATPAWADGSFVKIGTIRGTATEAQHQDWIDVGLWGIDRKNAGFWSFWTAPKASFWFEKRSDDTSLALMNAVRNKKGFDHILFDVSIKGEVLRTTFTNAHVVAVEKRGRVDRVTVQFKTQTDQRISFIATR